MTAETATDALVLDGGPTLDREVLRRWVVLALTGLLVLAGLVMTLHIFSAVGFAVYGLPRASFRRRDDQPEASAA